MYTTKKAIIAIILTLAIMLAAPAALATSDLSAYEAFGLRRQGNGLTYYSVNVRFFQDEAAGMEALNPQGNIDVYAVRDDNGALAGLRVSTAEEFAEVTNAHEAELRTFYASAQDANAAYLAEREWYASADPTWPGTHADDSEVWQDNPYTAYGDIIITENGYAGFGMTTHQGLLIYNGEYVRYLDDAGLGLHYENDGGTIDLYAVRDGSGTLAGFREATQEEYDANTKQYMAW